MAISITHQNRAARHLQAFVLCCDARYLPFAALTIHTLLQNNRDGNFDVCIASLEPLDLPAVLADAGVRFCQIDVGDAFAKFPTSKRFSMSAYLRMTLPQAMVDDYARICYLDSDVIVTGDDLASIFTLDLEGCLVGAISDNVKWKRPMKPTADQAVLGLNGPYFNSGVLLIDCQVYIEQQILETAGEIVARYGADRIYFDQTLLNLALAGNWAALHPAWNWQWSIVRPLFESLIDVQIVHFIGDLKPWSDTRAILPARYRETTRRFLNTHFAEVNMVSGQPDISTKNLVIQLIRHIGKAALFARLMKQHSTDIYKVSRPADL